MLPPDLKTVINSPRFGVRFININENFSHRPMAFKFYQYLFLLLLFISIKRSESAGNDSGEQGSSLSGDSHIKLSVNKSLYQVPAITPKI